VTKRRWIALGVAVVLVLGGAAGFVWWRNQSQTPQTQPAVAQPVAITVPDAPAEVKIGVVVTVASKPGEGSEWKYAAEGAQVAAQRLTMAGIKVQLETIDDKGSEAGARKAVEQLAELGVSGIVAASQGSHLRGAVAAAQGAGLPILLPYEPSPKLLGKLVWATGPQESAIGAALSQSLTSEKLKRTLLIDVGGGTPKSVEPAGKITFSPGDDVKTLIKNVNAQAQGKKKIDSILISGPAAQQAVVVQALQGADSTAPIFLTPDATSPAFTAALVDAGGSLSSSLATVGPDSDDAAALGSDASGKAMSAFLSATRLLAGDPQKTTLLGDQPFAKVAGAADVRSHDAVVALAYGVAALEAGKSTDPQAAIAGLKLDAFAADSVVALRSSDQDLGLRPRTDEATPRLIWFAAP